MLLHTTHEIKKRGATMKQIKQRIGYRVVVMGMVLTLCGGLLYAPLEKTHANTAIIKMGTTAVNPKVIKNLPNILPILQKWGPVLVAIGVGIVSVCGRHGASPQCMTNTLDQLVSQNKITGQQRNTVLLAVMKVCPGCVMASTGIQERLRGSHAEEWQKSRQQEGINCMKRGQFCGGNTIQERLRGSHAEDRRKVQEQKQKTLLKR